MHTAICDELRGDFTLLVDMGDATSRTIARVVRLVLFRN